MARYTAGCPAHYAATIGWCPECNGRYGSSTQEPGVQDRVQAGSGGVIHNTQHNMGGEGGGGGVTPIMINTEGWMVDGAGAGTRYCHHPGPCTLALTSEEGLQCLHCLRQQDPFVSICIQAV